MPVSVRMMFFQEYDYTVEWNDKNMPRQTFVTLCFYLPATNVGRRHNWVPLDEDDFIASTNISATRTLQCVKRATIWIRHNSHHSQKSLCERAVGKLMLLHGRYGGRHDVRLEGSRLASGVYFWHLNASELRVVRKIGVLNTIVDCPCEDSPFRI